MKYIIKLIVCDYAVICVDTGKVMCICNIKRNAELIADILNGDTDNSCAYSYDVYPNAKYKVVKAESEEEKKTETQEAFAKAKALQNFCESQTCDACAFRENLKEGEKWCGLNYPTTWVTPEAKIYKEAAESFYSGLIEGLKGTDGSEEEK